MKNFAVYSEDKALLRAFEEKIDKTSIKERMDKWNNMRRKNLSNNYILITVTEDKELYSYMYSNHEGSFATPTYILPQQWNEAVKALDELTQPQFKVGEWVETNTGDIGKIMEIVYKNKIKLDILNGYEHYMIFFYNSIQRHATKEEIKEELIRRSGLKVGDIVKYKNYSTEFLIEKFSLVTGLHKHNSISCYAYYNDNGIHLAVHGKDAMLPADQVKKVDNRINFEIETTEGAFKPKINDGQVKVGCVSWDKSNINFLYEFALWCKEQDVFVSLNSEGEIIRLRTNAGDVKEKITLQQIEQIVKALKK